MTALRLYREEQLFRNYIADGIYAMSNSIYKYIGGSCLQYRLSEIMNPPKEEQRTEDEVVDSIMTKLGAKRNGDICI